MDKIEELENRIGILERRFNVAILALNEVLREFEKVKHSAFLTNIDNSALSERINQSIRQKRERGKDEAQEIG